MKDYKLGSVVIMKKQHPCGENLWEVIRVGADIKIIMLSRLEFNKKLKKVVSF